MARTDISADPRAATERPAVELAASRSYLIGGGLIYGALGVYGMVIDRMSDANFVPVNDADNWLHIGLAAAMIILGLVLTPRPAGRA